MRIFSQGAVAALVVLTSLVISGGAGGAEPEVAVVVKIGGIPWFTAMEKGIKEAGKGQKVKADMVGPTTADPAQQVRAPPSVEELISRFYHISPSRGHGGGWRGRRGAAASEWRASPPRAPPACGTLGGTPGRRGSWESMQRARL